MSNGKEIPDKVFAAMLLMLTAFSIGCAIVGHSWGWFPIAWVVGFFIMARIT